MAEERSEEERIAQYMKGAGDPEIKGWGDQEPRWKIGGKWMTQEEIREQVRQAPMGTLPGDPGYKSQSQLQSEGLIDRGAERTLVEQQIKDAVWQGEMSPEEAQTYMALGLTPPDLASLDYESTRYDVGPEMIFERPEEAAWRESGYREGIPAWALKGALGHYAGVAATGEDAVSRATYEQAARESAMLDRAGREAALEGARARGVYGGGLEMADVLGSGQAAAERERMAGIQRAADVQTRRDAAVGAGANVAAGMAGGMDAYEAAHQGARQSYLNNVAAVQHAEEAANVGREWTQADKNVGLSNLDQQRRMDIAQQEWQNQLAKTGAVSGAALGQGQVELGQSQLKFQKEQANDPWNKYIQPTLGAVGTVGSGAVKAVID